MKPSIYRVKYSAKTKTWNAYTQYSYSPFLFPGIAGKSSLPQMMDRIAQIIQEAQEMAPKRYVTPEQYERAKATGHPLWGMQVVKPIGK